jgi:hypothetical protein
MPRLRRASLRLGSRARRKPIRRRLKAMAGQVKKRSPPEYVGGWAVHFEEICNAVIGL